MKPTKKTIGMLVAGAAAALTMSVSAAFAETTLVLSSWLPPRHLLVSDTIKPWARQVEEVTEGRVKVRILAKPLGAPPAHYDMASKGIADITYGLHSFTKDDRFLRSRIGQFAMIANDSESGSTALWDIYAGQLGAQDEHEGTKLLGLFVHGPGLLHNTVRKIETPADMAGLKIRTPGGFIADLMGDLGATTLFMSTGEVYEKLSRGVIDGCTMPFDGVMAFKLTEFVKYSMSLPGGFYNTTWFLAVNEAKWNSISAEDQAAIEAISGRAFAELAGKTWDEFDRRGREAVEKAGIELYEAPEAIVNAVRDAAATREAAWVEAVSATGYDGAAALAAFRGQTGIGN